MTQAFDGMEQMTEVEIGGKTAMLTAELDVGSEKANGLE